ncbi:MULTISPECIES: class I SAM-dependent methyltransferase [Methanoculleus]|uniref:Methyltransferase type 12 n=2 Tax=Methanoculleus TaxID=45989 RepID=A3CRY5_METMJ|nr:MULTISPECIES: class I SAM-dependent methyltransferase [Methanoculleus]ABN56135.1 Methyltransferase type 12 [Methanoculleus marisnigri JR1]UYU17606.1 class I SAM-dependent methyltransferase [Methanoculleus submarinus]
MDTTEKERLYGSYTSTFLGRIHHGGADEFPIYHKYFRRNYLMHLPVQKDARILDLGCGMGHFLNFLEKEGYRNYLGIDLSPENIHFCREHGYTVRMSDIFSFLEETTELFDAIVMNDVLEHFEKQEVIRFLDLAYQKLTSNGKLILKVPNAANPLLASTIRYIDFTHELSFTEVSLSQVLKKCFV